MTVEVLLLPLSGVCAQTSSAGRVDVDRWDTACAAQIVRHGRVVRPGLGVVCLPDNFAASVLKTKDERGVVIKEVMPGSGAAEAGLR